MKQEIAHHELNTIKLSIEAFQQYRSKTDVVNPEGCLLTMIRDEAEPNGQKTPESVESNSSMNSAPLICIQQVPKERLSFDNLQKLKSKFIEENE